MNEIKFENVYTEELAKDAILNEEYHGFREDYLVLHCLLTRHKNQIKRFLEVGTNMGTGTNIIKNALGGAACVYSLDLPTELAHISLQHPINEGKGDRVGHRCKLPFIQLRGDSLKFDYEVLGDLDAWFIDGEHDYDHPHHEAKAAIKSGAKLIIFHDSDIPCVYDAIADAFKGYENYTLYRVTDTRMAYALRKN